MSHSITRFSILDDQELVRKGIIKILSSFGSYVLQAEASDANQLLNSFKENEFPDICIIGVNNSCTACYAVLNEINNNWPNIKTLVLSVYASEDAIIQMLLRNANGYVLKSCTPSELQKAIDEIHNTGYYFSDIVTLGMKKVAKNSHTRWAFSFSEREVEFMKLCTLDITYKEIADKMLLSIKTVEHYREALFTRLKIRSRTGLVSYVYKNGLVQ